MTSPALDYFALEAADCLARLRRWRESGDAALRADARAAARALRGSAELAGDQEFALLGGALEAALAAPDGGDPLLGTALDEALAAADAAFRAPRPLGPTVVERVRAAAAVLRGAADALRERAPAGDGAPAPAQPPDASALPIVPVRALARDGDDAFVVRRAPAPPATAGVRFREASAPLARTLQRLVADARAELPAGAAPDPTLARTLGADLRAAVADLRELAESYDVAVPARFFARREAAAEWLDARTLDALAGAAAGLLGEDVDDEAAAAAEPELASEPAGEVEFDGAPVRPAEPDGLDDWAHDAAPPATAAHASAAAPDTPEREPAGVSAPGDGFRPPTGDALVALLETGITGLVGIGALDEAAPSPGAAEPADGVVPIDALVYRGRAAIARARVVRDALRARPGAPDPALLDELYDLLDLAAAD